MALQERTSASLTKMIDWDEDDLSEAQTNLLLQSAERRLCEGARSYIRPTEVISLHKSKLDAGPISPPYITSINGIARADSGPLLKDEDRRLSNSTKRVESPTIFRDKAAKLRNQTLSSHFDMPRTRLDDALKSDLSLLKLRSVLDPKQHYKKDASRSLVPVYSEVGRILEGPLEYKTRLPNRERTRTFVEEVLAKERITGRFKKSYAEIQSSRTSGKRAHYRKTLSKRKGGILKF